MVPISLTGLPILPTDFEMMSMTFGEQMDPYSAAITQNQAAKPKTKKKAVKKQSQLKQAIDKSQHLLELLESGQQVEKLQIKQAWNDDFLIHKLKGLVDPNHIPLVVPTEDSILEFKILIEETKDKYLNLLDSHILTLPNPTKQQV